MKMKPHILFIPLMAAGLASCDFQQANYNDRYGSNIDFGGDVGNASGSTFDFSGSSFDKVKERRGNLNIYRGDPEPVDKNNKKIPYYRGNPD